MKAVVIRAPGGPEVLEVREIAEPECGPHELLVAVHATALNRADLLQRRGRYPAPLDAPADIPGLEFAGEVLRCGERVRRFHSGDRVMGLLGGGGYAQRVAVDHRLCMRIPPALNFEQGAAVPEAFLTAYDALFLRGNVTAGETVLVVAAGSGVGTAAVQLAAIAGARVIACARSAAKLAALRDFPGVTAVDASAADYTRQIEDAAGGHVDVILELAGGSELSRHVERLADRGRLILIGLLEGARAEIDLSQILLRRLTICGAILRSRPFDEKVDLVRRFNRLIVPLFGAGRMRPVIDRVLPLTQVAEAHAAMERNENFGKIVLRVSG